MHAIVLRHQNIKQRNKIGVSIDEAACNRNTTLFPYKMWRVAEKNESKWNYFITIVNRGRLLVQYWCFLCCIYYRVYVAVAKQ